MAQRTPGRAAGLTVAVVASRSPVRALGHALRQPWVRMGTLASALLVLGSLTPAYLPENSPWWEPMRALDLDGLPGKIAGTVMVVGALGLLVQAWLRVRGHVRGHIAHWAVLVWWSLPMLLAPPVFSHDAYSYAAQGWLMHNGLNPYEVGPGALPGTFADQSPWDWRHTPAPYGPLALVIQHGLVVASGLSPYVAAVLMRVPAVAGVILIAVFLPRIAKLTRVNPDTAAWLAVLNPLLIVDFVGGAHNDAHMMGLVVLGVWLVYRHHWVWGALVIGVAATIKQPALLAAVAIPFGHHRLIVWRLRPVAAAAGRMAASLAVACGAFAAVSWATGYGFGWLNAVNVPGQVLTLSPFTLVGQLVQLAIDPFGIDPTGRNAIRYARAVGMVLSLALVAVLALRVLPRRPMRWLSWSYLIIALGGPALHGWYMLWGGVLLPLSKPGRIMIRSWVWASVLLLAYAAVNLSWRNGNLALGIAGMSLLVWIVIHHHRHDTTSPERLIHD